MSMEKARCPCCQHMVIKATMQPYARVLLCVECYTRTKLEAARTGRQRKFRIKSRKEPMVIKYGTAERVQKKDGKAVISKEDLSSSEIDSAVKDTKTASLKRRKPSSKKLVVTDEDYKQE